MHTIDIHMHTLVQTRTHTYRQPFLPHFSFSILPFRPARSQCVPATEQEVMQQAMYTAFAEIIADNSAYGGTDQNATQAWLDAAFAGPRRYSIMDAIGSVRSLFSDN